MQTRHFVGEAVKKLRESFETKHADICHDHNALREVIAAYDLMLNELVGRPPRNSEEVRLFFEKYLIITSLMSPIAGMKLATRLEEIQFFFP